VRFGGGAVSLALDISRASEPRLRVDGAVAVDADARCVLLHVATDYAILPRIRVPKGKAARIKFSCHNKSFGSTRYIHADVSTRYTLPLWIVRPPAGCNISRARKYMFSREQKKYRQKYVTMSVHVSLDMCTFVAHVQILETFKYTQNISLILVALANVGFCDV
jgi:hypothetical protein